MGSGHFDKPFGKLRMALSTALRMTWWAAPSRPSTVHFDKPFGKLRMALSTALGTGWERGSGAGEGPGEDDEGAENSDARAEVEDGVESEAVGDGA